MASDNQSTTHTVVWFYLTEELENARTALHDARIAAAVYWGSAEAQHKAVVAAFRVADLERAAANG